MTVHHILADRQAIASGFVLKLRAFFPALLDSFDYRVVTSDHLGTYGNHHFALQSEKLEK